MIGETILHYKILEKLGEGGMGEVFKAQDTKLDRFVALKFLSSSISVSEDDKARFIQEAKAASAMNHPNICTIYDIQENDGQLFIVMEFVEGKTLKNLVETHRDASLPERQKLEIGVQVAEGLSAAHEKGIVHRDIKPENIMIRKDGIAQIMDFGLAKLHSSSEGSRLTKVGTTMGTMGYMSPEQIQGLDVDHRSDIFSFGVVLYEMFAGESPFKGIHETAIMYEIVNVEAPPISTVKTEFDLELDEIILECLEKDKDDRYQSAKELAKDLRKIKKSTGHRKSRVYNVNTATFQTKDSQSVVSKSSGSISIEAFNKKFYLGNILSLRNISWLIVLLLLAFIFIQAPWNKTESIKTEIKFYSDLDKDSFFELNYPAVNISSDGSKIVYSANSNLFLRNLNSLDAILIPGTENAINPVFSPDGNSIAYFQLGKLKKLALNGGAANILVSADAVSRGVSWGTSQNIVYSPTTTNGLFIIPDNGGTPKQITFIDSTKKERTHRWPQFLPNGKNVLFTVGYLNNPDYYEDADIDIVNIETGKRKNIIKGSSSAKYINSGQIIYSKSGTLYAVSFDADNLELTGQPVPVVEGVNGDITSGSMHYSISENGTLTYIPGQVEGGNRTLVFINGKEEKIIDLPPKNYMEPKMSPDGKELALVVREGIEFNIYIYNFQMKALRKFTFGEQNRTPTWSSDGKKIVYMKVLPGIGSAIFIKYADGSKIEEEVFRSKDRLYIDGWSKDQSTVLVQTLNGTSQTDLYYLKLGSENKLNDFLTTSSDEWTSSLSPDGKWIAYVSSESGTYQAYIQSFPEKGGKWQISVSGASAVAWAPDQKTIYFESNSIIYGAPITASNTLSIGTPKEIIRGLSLLPVDSGHTFDITPDSKYIITTKPATGNKNQRLIVVINWVEGINKLTQERN